jgi:hypothetical protein
MIEWASFMFCVWGAFFKNYPVSIEKCDDSQKWQFSGGAHAPLAQKNCPALTIKDYGFGGQNRGFGHSQNYALFARSYIYIIIYIFIFDIYILN